MHTHQSAQFDTMGLETCNASGALHPRNEPHYTLTVIPEHQSLVTVTSSTDFCQDFVLAGTRFAPCVTSKANTDVAGSSSDCFAHESGKQMLKRPPQLLKQTTSNVQQQTDSWAI